MKCEAARLLLTAFYDGELEPMDQASVGEHLKSCSQCTAELADIRRLSERAKAAVPALPPGLAAKVQAHLSRPAVQPRTSRRFIWIAAAAAAVIVMASLMALLPHRDDPAAVKSLEEVKNAFLQANTMHLVQTYKGQVQYDLWFGNRHTEDGKVCWAVATPNNKQPLTVPFVARPFPEYDGILIRLDFDPPQSGMIMASESAAKAIRTASGWELTYDPSTHLPIQRQGRIPDEVLHFEFDKPLPGGLEYSTEARPHVQLK